MKNVIASCVPRKSIVEGTFNPEVFTATLGPVVNYYRNGSSTLDSVYTNAETFFRDATYVTDGLRSTVNNIFRRIAGDTTAPSIQRLETAFGGGKTHTLIACVHIANRGKDIAGVVSDIIDSQYLPDSGTVTVVGIAGDEIKTSQTIAGKVVPYTLWGEMALQIGGQELYNAVKKDAESYSAPGSDYFETVLGNRKLLIVFDELAQYASRLEVLNNSSDQLAAFLMTLNTYVRNRPGIAVVVTLAGSVDAFAKETEKIGKVLNTMTSKRLTQDDVMGVTATATKNLKSVVMRDASAVTPVQANEISAVLAKRLFESVDIDNAKEVARAYKDTYTKNKGMLPQEATSMNFEDRMVQYYPFHPTLIDFLNNKLALAENFQGTRGVLRTLAMAVRSIWKAQKNILLIHVSDIDLHNASIVDEILGRTGSSDLKQVLTADVGSVETESHIKGGKSNAQYEDENNPHPDGIAMFENTWKVVFLNSLVGRAQGLSSNVFGVSEQDAIFQTATPELLPSQVRMALEKITDVAYYLRCEHGKYFAHLEPTINSVLARIRGTIEYSKVLGKLKSVANNLVTNAGIFAVEHNVTKPDDIRDDYEKPVVGVVSLEVEGPLNVENFYKFKAGGQFRTRKNLLMLLVPKTIKLQGLSQSEYENVDLFDEFANNHNDEKEKERVEDLARQVLAINILQDNPEEYGISSSKLQDPDFRNRQSSRPQELAIAVANLYTNFVFYSVDGIVRREIKTGSGESTLTLIQKKLVDDNELILQKTDKYGTAILRDLSDNYIFKTAKTVECKYILDNFYSIGNWPVLANKSILDSMLREGVESGLWAIYKKWSDPTQARPTEIYFSDKPVPMNLDIINLEYKATTVDFAKKSGWLDVDKPSPEKVKEAISKLLANNGAVAVDDIVTQVKLSLAKAEDNQIYDGVQDLATNKGYAIYRGKVDQVDRPKEEDCFEGYNVPGHPIEGTDVLISRSEQSQRGWFTNPARGVHVQGSDGDNKVQKVVELLGSLGSSYRRGKSKSEVDSLDLYDLRLPSGGTMRIALANATAQDFKMLDELLNDVKNKLKVSGITGVDVEIKDPQDGCEFAEAIKTLQ